MAKRHHPRLQTEALEDRVVPSVNLDGVEFRTIDGTKNNAALPQQGAAETEQIRFGYGQRFPDGFGDAVITTPQRANPRSISNAIHAQSGSVLNDRHLTDWAFQWGQWITHDMDLTRNGPEFNRLSNGQMGNFSIPILDPGDPLGPSPIPFNRSQFVGGVPGDRRDVVNSITSYIDASMVYGSDAMRAAALRTFQGGQLKTSANGQLLPLNTPGLPNADESPLPGDQLFLAGDVRANEQLNLTAVHTLFVREHNRLAARIAQLNPGLTDEQVYQVARRIVGAEMQIITYEEYLPAIFGHDLAPNPHDAAYDPGVDASVTNSFAHAVFRFGHSQISESTLLVNNQNQSVGSLTIRDAFFNPNFLKNDPSNLGRMLKGLASQVGQENDLLLVNGVRNSLFGPPGAGGLDLAALDIQRGRDHGLPDYNNLRGAYGAGAIDSFDDISSDPAIQAKLQQVYGNVNNIDAFVGALAEDHLPGSSVGPFIHALVGNQFDRLRDGDRHFYTIDPFLASPGVREIIDLDAVSLSQIIKWNTGIQNIQDNVFFDRSVLVFEAPNAGANVSLVAGAGVVSLVNTRTGQLLALRSLAEVSQVILVGSNLAADFFNVFVSAAHGGIEDGVLVFAGDSTGDKLNVYGTLVTDTFTVADRTVSTGGVDVNGDDVVQTFAGESTIVNGNGIRSAGLERIRLVKVAGTDNIHIGPGIAPIVDVVTWWDPWDER